jgi:hypothetical protein
MSAASHNAHSGTGSEDARRELRAHFLNYALEPALRQEMPAISFLVCHESLDICIYRWNGGEDRLGQTRRFRDVRGMSVHAPITDATSRHRQRRDAP